LSPPLKLKVVFHQEEDGRYSVFVPGFPGCSSWGETLEEARANIHEAFAGVLEAMQDEPLHPEDQYPNNFTEEIDL
jgi:predicted RNase H-like HicB family nuclease